MKNIVLIILAVLLVLGISCTTRVTEPPRTAEVSIYPKTTVPAQKPLCASDLVHLPPKIKTVNWSASLSPMVKRMLQVDGINDGSLLLINTLKNATNGNVQADKATAVLTRLIKENGSRKFQVVDIDKLNAVRQALKLSSDDSLELCSKAVGLARHLNAQYVLYSAASGDVKAPMLNLQLILVKTGEIIWSGNSIVQD